MRIFTRADSALLVTYNAVPVFPQTVKEHMSLREWMTSRPGQIWIRPRGNCSAARGIFTLSLTAVSSAETRRSCTQRRYPIANKVVLCYWLKDVLCCGDTANVPCTFGAASRHHRGSHLDFLQAPPVSGEYERGRGGMSKSGVHLFGRLASPKSEPDKFVIISTRNNACTAQVKLVRNLLATIDLLLK